MSIGKLDGGTTESHEATPRQRLHLQRRSGKTHNGRRVGAHGFPHHLINGGDFGFWKGLQKIDGRCRQDTHSQDTLVHVQLITAQHRAVNVLGPSRQGPSAIGIASLPQNKCCHMVCHMSHPCVFSHAPFSMSTSSSSSTFPTAQQEHSVHPAHFQEHLFSYS